MNIQKTQALIIACRTRTANLIPVALPLFCIQSTIMTMAMHHLLMRAISKYVFFAVSQSRYEMIVSLVLYTDITFFVYYFAPDARRHTGVGFWQMQS